MQEILKDDVFLHKINKQLPNNRQLWKNFPILQDNDMFTGNAWNKTGGVGLPPVPMEHLLNIDMMAQYTMHHSQLGSNNTTHGIAMNVACQADQHSVFGYLLGHMLGPCLS
jgi:hypothetical protein